MLTRDADVVVVGGGLAGLAAAAFLARAGRRVQVFERAVEVGGRARTRTLNGYHFNQGAHALYRLGPGIKVLDELGVSVSGRSPDARGAIPSLFTKGTEGRAAPLARIGERWSPVGG